MELTLKERAIIEFTKGTVDITDPCYDNDVWCRNNNLSIEPGGWMAINWVADGRTFCLELFNLNYLEDYNTMDQQANEIGKIGVDAGMVGVFENKPNYNEEEWFALCDATHHGKLTSNKKEMKCKGVICCSGYGDGYYSVYGFKNENKYTYLRLEF